MIFNMDNFSADSRYAFERRSRFLFRNLRMDLTGRYVSERTRRAWETWLRAHPDRRVLNALWTAAGQPGGACRGSERSYQDTVLCYVHRLSAGDTKSAQQRRITHATECGNELKRVRGLFGSSPDLACSVQQILLWERA